MTSRFHKRVHFIALSVALAFAAACGGAGEQAGGEAETGAEEAGGRTLGDVVDLASAATISGSVNFEGTPPELEPIDMSEEPECADDYEGQPTTQRVEVNENGTLQWVFVYVKSGQTQDGRAIGELDFPVPQQPVVLDQQGCRYHPHVFGIQVGQTLEIKNSDGILHNINAKPNVARGFNISQPVEMSSTRTFSQSEVMIPVECDVHGWMQAYAGVLTHPYHSTTNGQGSFSIDRLPPGTYTIEAWHEEYGTQTQEVTVGPNETAELSFTFGPAAA